MNKNIPLEALIEINKYCFEIPQEYRADMRVPARIFTSREMLAEIVHDKSLWQIVNVAALPGIVQYAFAMPDIHQGYGFPIGGVAAFDINEGGVISPGGIGYDINCGVRLLVSDLSRDEIKPYIEDLATALFRTIPSGVGRGGKLKMSEEQMRDVLEKGAPYMVSLGYGTDEDVAVCEENGAMPGANADLVSPRARKRGRDQLGTLGSGNHFLEVQCVEKIYDEQAAQAFGLKVGQVAIMIHCGSRGLGHQTCTDYVKLMMPKIAEWGLELPDRELVCAPFNSQDGQDYFGAMAGAANFAWANRHVIGHWVREAWHGVVGNDHALTTVYDVSHNMGKRETHTVAGKQLQLVVHRKGATRSFGPGRPEVPERYRAVGQPVFIPGTMGTASYVLAGTEKGMEVAFGTTCHGAGRRLSRMKAKKTVRGSELRKELEARGIVIRCDSDPGLAEEAPIAYKDVDNVVEVVHNAGLAKRVARLAPIAVIKGG